MSAFVIRDAGPDDRDQVDALTRLAYREFGSIMEPSAWGALEASIHSVLKNPGEAECIVAEDNGRIIGSVFLFPIGKASYKSGDTVPSPELRLLAVAPNARGRGVGRALVEECIRRARASGATELGLHTSKSLATALALYESMGFSRAPERDFHPEGAELVQGYRLQL